MTERSANIVRVGQDCLYRCNDCRALLLDADDAREHLWWHDDPSPERHRRESITAGSGALPTADRGIGCWPPVEQ